MKQIFTFLATCMITISYAQSFQNTDLGLPNLSSSTTSLGDFDNDGDLDLYLTGLDAASSLVGGLYIYDNGAYTLSTTANLPLTTFGSARWGDIDNDGDLDILIQGYDNVSAALTDVYLNNNDGTFTALNLGLIPSYLGEIAFADINNDNFLDIAVTGFETNTWSTITKIYTNNQDNTFTELTSLTLPGMNFGRIKFADYNNDGFQDFVLSGWGSSFYTVIYSNNGDETFTEQTGITLFQSWLGDTEWVDYNTDGNVDLLISGTGGSGTDRHTDLYKNNGDGTFTNINAGFTGVSHSSLEYADFDNDGDIDIVVIGVTTAGEYIYNLYNNDGSDAFSVSNAITQGAANGDADSGDIDGNGKIDLVISGNETAAPITLVLLNNTVASINNELLLNSISIYPNPSTDKQTTIKFETEKTPLNIEIEIYSTQGKQVLKKQFNSINNHFNKTIDVSGLDTGLYIIKIKSGNNSITRKLLLK